jgi:hypothetical protein
MNAFLQKDDLSVKGFTAQLVVETEGEFSN